MNIQNLESDVYYAGACLGWIVPRDDEEVSQAEAELAKNPVRLPVELASPGAIADGGARPAAASTPSLQYPEAPDIQQNLARAAREGGIISPEVEEMMRRDRQAAESAAEKKGGIHLF